MSDLLAILACAWLFAMGLWLCARPWAHRHWLRDAEAGHRTRASLYEAHMGEAPDWLDDFTPPLPPPAVRNARIYRWGGLAAMATATALLYIPLSRTGVL